MTDHAAAASPEVLLFTDGACSGNPGRGGWAFILKHPASGKVLEHYGAEVETTNNRMELMAVIQGLSALKKTEVYVEIFTDSEYVRKGITEWISGWKRRGWKTADNKPVKNADLWVALEAQTLRHDVAWHWVKGHAGDPGNERADALANRGAAEA